MEEKIKKIQQNTLKMIRNNAKFENLIEDIIKKIMENPIENKNSDIIELINKCIKSLEEYDI